MKATPIPRHVSATMTVAECYDLVVTLRAAVRDLDAVPESITETLAALTEAYLALGDLPQIPSGDDNAGSAA